jgi:hypothetical protein
MIGRMDRFSLRQLADRECSLFVCGFAQLQTAVPPNALVLAGTEKKTKEK